MYEDKINLNEVVETMQQQVLDNITSSETETEDNYALENHTHSQYALLNHRHSGYANVTHTHNDYATLDNIQTVTDDINNNINNSSDRIINELSEEIQNVNVGVDVSVDNTEVLEKLDNLKLIKNVHGMDRPPEKTDDVTQGFDVGSKWSYDTESWSKQYECLTPLEESARWDLIQTFCDKEILFDCDIYNYNLYNGIVEAYGCDGGNGSYSITNNGVLLATEKSTQSTTDRNLGVASGYNIDLTNVNYLIIDVSFETTASSYAYGYVQINKTIGDSTSTNAIRCFKSNCENKLYYLDVREYTGLYFIQIGVKQLRTSTTTSYNCVLNVHSLYLSYDNKTYTPNHIEIFKGDGTDTIESINSKLTVLKEQNTTGDRIDYNLTANIPYFNLYTTSTSACIVGAYTDLIDLENVEKVTFHSYFSGASTNSYHEYVYVYLLFENCELTEGTTISSNYITLWSMTPYDDKNEGDYVLNLTGYEGKGRIYFRIKTGLGDYINWYFTNLKIHYYSREGSEE